MGTTSRQTDSLPPAERWEIDKICDQFEAAWKEGQTPSVDEFISHLESSQRLAVLRELIILDLGYRWRQSPHESETQFFPHSQVDELTDHSSPQRRFFQRPLLDDYVDRFTELGGLADLPIELIFEEFRARQQSGNEPDREEYVSRFAGHPNLDELLTHMERVRQQTVFRENPGTPSGQSDELAPTAAIADTDDKCDGFSLDDTEEELPEIDGYDIRGCLGRGGMGVVYGAFQRSTGKRVAIKVMREMATSLKAARRRFQREVEIVARLRHPRIASIIDSGIHHGGYFYVMEYIEGRTLDKGLCNDRLTVRDALVMIAEVCDTVEYAHQRGVLHRDLKPSNILVDVQGRPHVLDFGLAKPIDSRVDIAEMSMLGQPIGTLPYMSPEQSRGEIDQIGVRSDVYSLGVVAYQLVTGRLPYRADGPVLDVLERIAHEIPQRPSIVVRSTTVDGRARKKGSSWLGARFASDRDGVDNNVDAILLKCLEKESEQRYASAREMAAEIRRWLDGHIVRARRAGRIEQTWRWARRNPALSTFITATLSLLIAVAIGSTWAALYIRATRNQEQQARIAAEMVSDFLVGLFESSDPVGLVGYKNRLSPRQSPDTSVREILDLASVRIRDELMDTPSAQATLMDSIGKAYLGLGMFPEAISQFEHALQVRSKTLPARHPDTLTSYMNLGMGNYANGAIQKAEQLYRQALEGQVEVFGHENLQVATTKFFLAMLLFESGAAEEAESLYRQCLNARQKILGNDHRDTAIASFAVAGVLFYEQRSLGQAAYHLDQALRIVHRLDGDREFDAEAVSLVKAYVDLQRGEFEDAERRLRNSEVIIGRVLGEEHPVCVYLYMLLGQTLSRQDDHDAGERYLRKALKIVNDTVPTETVYRGNIRMELAYVLVAAGKHDLAIEELTAAQHSHEKLFDQDHEKVYRTWDDIAVLQAHSHPQQYRQTCSEILHRYRDSQNVNVASSIARVCALAGGADDDWSLPIQLARHALHGVPDSNLFHGSLGAVLYRAGRYEEAALELRLAAKIRNPQDMPWNWLFLAMALHKLGSPEQAGVWLEKASNVPSLHPVRQVEWEILHREAMQLIHQQGEFG